MPMISAARMIFLVMARSSADGSRSFDGWLWQRIIAAELPRMAGFRASRGWTGADERVPTATIFKDSTDQMTKVKGGENIPLEA